MSDNRHSTSRRIAAPAATIWAIVSDPNGHVAIDGSGMLEAAVDAKPVAAVGDTFDMDMDRTPLNDIPGLVKYKVRNIVTALEPGRLIEWTVGGIDNPPVGHVYGWQLEPAGDDATVVTHYCDWTGISDKMRSARPWPVVPLEMLEGSIAKLEQLALERAGS